MIEIVALAVSCFTFGFVVAWSVATEIAERRLRGAERVDSSGRNAGSEA